MRVQLLADLLGAHPAEHTLAYILVPDAFPHRAGTVRVMNSADLTTLGLPPPRSARRILEGLKRIPLLSARDSDSQALCLEHGITAELAPDVVHTLLDKVGDLPASPNPPRADASLGRLPRAGRCRRDSRSPDLLRRSGSEGRDDHVHGHCVRERFPSIKPRDSRRGSLDAGSGRRLRGSAPPRRSCE